MGFKLVKGCRDFFENIYEPNSRSKLSFLFDEYYLCLMVGFAQVKIDTNACFESDFIDDFVSVYQENKEYIIGLLIATEVKFHDIDVANAVEFESHMKKLVGGQARTYLTSEGMEVMNKYAAYGFNCIKEKMGSVKYINLEEFYEDYFGYFEDGSFFSA